MKYTYFILNPDTGRIKIGQSANPEKRKQSLETGAGTGLELWGYTSDPAYTEADLHDRLAVHRCQGEWFESHPEVIATAVEALGRCNEICLVETCEECSGPLDEMILSTHRALFAKSGP